MIPTELYSRNALMAIDVFIRGMDLQTTQQKYCITLSSLRAVLIHMAWCTLGYDCDSLWRIRQAVRQRLIDECLLQPERGLRAAGIG